MRLFPLLPWALALTTTLAHADTLQSFNFQGTLDTGDVTGTLTIDTTIGSVTAATFNISDFPAGSLTPTSIALNETPLSTEISLVAISNAPEKYYASVDLVVPTFTLVGYNGGNLCLVSAPCDTDSSGVVYEEHGHDLLTGSITPVAATPEPSTLALLGTGTLTLFGAIRRRLRP